MVFMDYKIGVNFIEFSLRAFLPIIVAVLFGFLIMLWDVLWRGKKDTELLFIAIIGFLLIIIVSVLLPTYRDGAFIILDGYAKFFYILFSISALLTIFISYRYLTEENLPKGEFYELIYFATAGMMLFCSAKDFLTLYLGLELMALSIYILTGFYRRNVKSNEAAMKYFLLGIFSSAFLLLGISLIYGYNGNLNIYEAIKATQNNSMVTFSLLLFIVAFGFKIATVPFHIWTPDAYEGAPTPITAFMSVAPKAAVFATMIRVFIFTFRNFSINWTQVFLILSALTMTFGNVVAIMQNNVKRMLAYSSIAHAGYILVAFVSINKNLLDQSGLPDAISSILFYLLAYAFMNIGAFSIIIILGREGKVGSHIEDYNALAYKHPAIAFAMTIFMLSLTGIPPTAGFVGKLYLFGSAIKAKLYWLVVLALLNSVISLYYYMRIPMKMYMGKDPENKKIPLMGNLYINFAIVIMTILTLFLGLFSGPIINIIRNSVQQFFYI